MEPQSLALTAKVRLYPTAVQAQEFEQVSEAYRQACNIVSQWVFDNKFTFKRKDFNRDMYYLLKSKYPTMNTAMVQSTYRTVNARYQTIATQLAQNPMRYKIAKKKYIKVKRDLLWLTKPVFFKRPQADYLRNTNYRFNFDKDYCSLNVLEHRIKVQFNHYFAEVLQNHDKYQLGTSKLVKAHGHWFLHVSYTQVINQANRNDIKRIVGIDRGLRFIATCYDGNNTKFISGKKLIHIRKKYQRLRSQLQSKHTASSRRRLKKIGSRENRYVTDMNHCISKTLVEQYQSNTLFVLEDLTGIRDTTEKHNKTNRYADVSWPFYQLEQMLTYKASLHNSLVVKVSAQYTSQRCYHCGRINKANRHHDTHEYICDRCKYRTNDDRIAGQNLYELGKWYVSNIEQPKFIKTKENSD